MFGKKSLTLATTQQAYESEENPIEGSDELDQQQQPNQLNLESGDVRLDSNLNQIETMEEKRDRLITLNDIVLVQQNQMPN